jgi:uncharacterized protein DUF5999
MYEHQPPRPDAVASDRMAARVMVTHPEHGWSPPCNGVVLNKTELYHSDRSRCVDPWSCRRDDHTTVTPQCGARTLSWPAACEFPAGHPGPHLPAAS